MQKLPVIFRKDLHPNVQIYNEPEVTAVFPTETYTGMAGQTLMVCYAHIGQHGPCTRDWYYKDSRPAKPEEYASLLAELKGIYETGPDAVQLVICKRMPAKA